MIKINEVIHIWLFIMVVSAIILGKNPNRGGIPAIERIASDVGRILRRGNIFSCLILLMESLCNIGKRIKIKIPYIRK